MTTVYQRHTSQTNRQTDKQTDNIRWHYPHHCCCTAR